jgi:hypothetical protein
MAKKKPAAKMPVKKPVAKKSVTKPKVKAAPKKEVKKMAKKAPVKKAAPAKKAPAKKTAPAKKAVAKKVTTKKTAPASKTLKEKVLKAATDIVKKVGPKAPAKELTKAQKEKEAKEKKAAAEKEKSKAAADKKKAKELEKKQKEEEKLNAKKAKETAKSSKKKSKKKGDVEEEFDEDEDIELGPDDEPAFGEERVTKAKEEDDDFDEFEEEYKKSKAKKTGKKAYEEDADQVDLFETKPAKKYSNTLLSDLETKIADEIAELREHFNWKDITDAIGTMDFFIDPKNDECIEKGCDNIRTTQSYCRLHYLRNWKVVQKKRDILKEGKLQEYIEELISKYPPKYIEALLSDLSDDKEFYKVLNELNITSEFDYEEEDFDNSVDDDDSDDDIGIETISGSMRYEDE